MARTGKTTGRKRKAPAAEGSAPERKRASVKAPAESAERSRAGRGNRRSKAQRDLDRVQLTRWIVAGRSQRWMAAQLGVHESQISRQVKEILKQAAEDAARDRPEIFARLVLRFEHAAALALRKLEKSKTDTHPAGNPQWLRAFIAAGSKLAELLAFKASPLAPPQEGDQVADLDNPEAAAAMLEQELGALATAGGGGKVLRYSAR